MKIILSLLAQCLFLTLMAQQPKVDTALVYSDAMHKNVKAVVVLPDAYFTGSNHFAVVYLLHGYSGSYKNWPTKMPHLQKWATENNLILVCPDGGYGGWYVNSEFLKENQYETFISKELVAYVDKQYRTNPTPLQRGITGLSMGGHGALMLGITHPEVYGAAASMSGAVDLIRLANRYEIKNILGDTATYLNSWKKYSVVNLADTLTNKKMPLLIDCGIEDIFINENRLLHQRLIKQQINHTYIERNGGHNWYYWTNALPDHLLFFRKFFTPQ